MIPTDEISDPNWNDIFDRDREIKRLRAEIESLKGDLARVDLSSRTREDDKGVRIHWLPAEVDQLRLSLRDRDDEIDDHIETIEFLRRSVQNAPCEIARNGEGTYECRHDSPCRVCAWRAGVSRSLKEEMGYPDGIW